MSTHGLLFQWGSTIKIYIYTENIGLVHSGHHHYFIKDNSHLPWYSLKIAELALDNNHSIIHSLENSDWSYDVDQYLLEKKLHLYLSPVS